MTKRMVGTIARGLRTPIITEGDDIVQIVVDTVLKTAKNEGFSVRDRDIISITESVVARAQGNYVLLEEIKRELEAKFPEDEIGVVFPILSRNRFALILKSVVQTGKKVTLFLNYPGDEVGNRLIDPELFYASKINPYSDVLSEEQFRASFGSYPHPFTGIDYVTYYKSILAEGNPESSIVFTNNAETVLNYTQNILIANVHDRVRTKKTLLEKGAQRIYGLDDLVTKPTSGQGYNPEYGLLGSNKATETKLKLFPRDGQVIVEAVQKQIKEKTGKLVEVLIYGDGAFKDPVGGIWELADPVAAPAYTAGLEGTPSEVKLKYLADLEFGNLRGLELTQAITNYLESKDVQPNKAEVSQGTTPRRLTDLLSSLSDLTSGSGDKGTPVVYIQGYFDTYAN